MCGRYVVALDPADLAAAFDAHWMTGQAERYVPSWNVTRTSEVPVLLERLVDDAPRRSVALARWGLVPRWARDTRGGAHAVNARSETAAEKPSFRDSVLSMRCAIPAEGYFEWRESSPGQSGKQPHYVHRADDAPIAFAGLYSWWRLPSGPLATSDTETSAGWHGRWLLSCSILTTEAPSPDSSDPALGDLGRLHHRLPLGLGPEALSAWLDPRCRTPLALLDRIRGEAHTVSTSWRLRTVGKSVGSTASTGPDLIREVPPGSLGTPGSLILDDSFPDGLF